MKYDANLTALNCNFFNFHIFDIIQKTCLSLLQLSLVLAIRPLSHSKQGKAESGQQEQIQPMKLAEDQKNQDKSKEKS